MNSIVPMKWVRTVSSSVTTNAATFLARSYLACLLSLAFVAMTPNTFAQVEEESVREALEVREHDVVIKSDGVKLKGEILNRTQIRVEFRTHHNVTVTLEMSDIAKIVPRVTPEQVYENRRRRIDKGRHEDQTALGVWCTQYSDLSEQATAHLIESTRLSPASVDAYEALIPLFEQAPSTRSFDELDAELGVYQRGMKAGVAKPELPYRAGLLFEDLEEWSGAVRMYKVLLAESSYRDTGKLICEDAEERLVGLLDRTGQREQAQELMDQVLSSRPASEAVPFLERRAQWLLEEFSAGVADRGVEFTETVNSILESDASRGAAYLLRGTYRLLREDFKGANADFLKAQERGQVSGPAIATYGLTQALQGNNKAANSAIAMVRTSKPTVHKLIKAYVLENQGRDDAAMTILGEVFADNDAPWQGWFQYLQTKHRLTPDEPLGSDLERYLARFRGHGAAFAECALLVGQLALEEGDGQKARNWLDYAGMIHDGDAEYYAQLGQAQLMTGGDPVRARACLEEAHRLEPDNLQVRNALGYLEYRERAMSIAQAHFRGVLAAFPEEERTLESEDETVLYALRGLEQIDRALTDELWIDDFGRPDNDTVMKNWRELETYGVEVGLNDMRAQFDGTQKFQDDGLTVLSRLERGERMSRFRAKIRIQSGAPTVRIALRLEDGRQEQGLSFYRDKDGFLAFSLNRRSGSDTVHPKDRPAPVPNPNPDEPDEQPDWPGKDFDLQEVEWVDDRKFHMIEIRLDEEGRTAALFFDGDCVARDVPVPFANRGDLYLGVSGQASMGSGYRFEVESFEVFRRRIEKTKREQR